MSTLLRSFFVGLAITGSGLFAQTPPPASAPTAAASPTSAAAKSTLVPGSAIAKTLQNIPLLPGRDGTRPVNKPGVARTTGDEDEMDDLDVQRRTTGEDQGTAPLANPKVVPGATVARPVANGPTLPGKDGTPPPTKAGVARTTGDEDEMDDLDVQRRTAPDDQSAAPLTKPGAALTRSIVGPSPAVVRAAGATARPPLAPKSNGVARTTGDEDEMDDLDVQRRTAPDDQNAAALPKPALPTKGTAAAARPANVPPAPRTGVVALPNTANGTLPPASAPRGIGAATNGAASLRLAKPVFATNELVTVEFAGTSGLYHDWVCVVAADAPDTDHGLAWNYLKGEATGRLTFSRLLPAGRYEVRLYGDWPRGGHTVLARAAFEVR